MRAGVGKQGRRARLGIAFGLLSLGALVALPGSAGAAISCEFSGSDLTVALSANNDFAIIERSGQDIQVVDQAGPDPTCTGGTATVTNTAQVEVEQPGAGQASQFHISQFGGAFEPGTGGPAEGGGTSEIEFDVDLGDGNDSVQVSGRTDPAVDHMRFGELASGNLGVNLNAPETGQPDGDDVELQGVDFITVALGGPFDTAADTLDGSGGPEFVGGFPLNFGGVGGGGGPDTLVGGDAGGTYDGFGGDDTLVSRPGSFSEALRGGEGTDLLDYSLATSGVTVNLGTDAGQNTGGAGFDILNLDVEDLTGSQFDDELTGTSGENRVVGAGGADNLSLLDGGDEFDVLDNGIADTVDCGDGADAGVADVQGVDTLINCETVDFPPQTSIAAGPADGATINDSTPTYTLSADEQATFEFAVDGASFQSCSTNCTIASPPLSEGAHTIAFRATDQDPPNTADPTPITRDVTIDVTPPQTEITSGPGEGGTIADSTPSFGFGSEPGATFQCKLDSGSFANCTSPLTTSELADGDHNFQVRARDEATNLDPTPASRSFTVDTTPPNTTPPDTTITRGPKAKVKTRKKKAKASFEFSSNDPGASFECSLDAAAFEPCTSPVTEKVKKGKHVFEVRGTDQVGNVEPQPAAHTWKVKRKKKRR